MRYDAIIAGIGGQGIIAIASVLLLAAERKGLKVRQSEIHGMAQRGGAVSAQIRIADTIIYSSIIAKGTADLILSMEPLESLRYVDYLSANGILITAKEPINNIPNYPDLESLYHAINTLPHAYLVDSKKNLPGLAASSANMVLIGFAMQFLPLEVELIKLAIRDLFAYKGETVVANNLHAFELGMQQHNL